MEPIRVSVVINTLDRADQLERTLESLAQLRYPAFEVVVVHGPCRDRTQAVLARFSPAIRIGACAHANLALSRNIGLGMAQGDVVAFLDDDAIPEPDWLDLLAPAFADPSVGGVGGFIRDRDGVHFQHRGIVADRLGEAESLSALPPELPAGRYFSPTGTNVALRREALLAIGGFDEEYAYFLDETDVNLRLTDAGWRLVSVPEAEVHHKFAASNLRRIDRVPRSLYLIARSKSYFCWVNAAGSHSPGEIEEELDRFRDEHRGKVERFLKRRKIDKATADRLLAEIDQGLADGRRDAGRPRRLLALRADEDAEPFRPFATRSGGLRLCIVARRFGAALRDAAAALVEGGHAVTVIRRGAKASVEFQDGLWLHTVVPAPVSLMTVLSTAGRFAAAAAVELERIQPRRRFQTIAGPAAEIAKVRNLGIPTITWRSGMQPRDLLAAAGPR